MSQLKYRTRSMSSPERKQKIYFSCHPDDFAKYFEEIADDILEKQDCVIWYEENREDGWNQEEHFRNLGQMLMLVIPVTNKFLKEPNRAKDLEFPYAVENHIPILPVMVENGLEETFNQVCGELQFLDRNNTDQTAISYENKLDTFLSSVLVGEEQILKIKEAFEGYIFLSYRKKDRWQAQNLMELLHKCDFCRDVAIWYDEFLVPGENFNRTIEEALEKSRAFVMAITPNMVNEVNYVMTTEYPMAREKNKFVIPVIMTETEEEQLKEKFEDIPDPVPGGYVPGTELKKALKKCFKEIEGKKRNDSPDHLYYMGLAYLNGIDMEINQPRAKELLTTAAEKGYEPAMKKLADMYRYGDGVERDYHQCLSWQEKLVEAGEKRLLAGGTFEAGEISSILNQRVKLANDYASVWQDEKSKECYEKIMFYTRNLKEEGSIPIFGMMYLLSCQMVATWHGDHGNLEEAKAYCEETMELAYKLPVNELTEANMMEALQLVYTCYGQILQKTGEKEQAEEYFRKSQNILVEKAYANERTLSYLVGNYLDFETLRYEADDLEGAKTYCDKCMELLQKYKKKKDTPGYLGLVTRVCWSRGEIAAKEKDWKEALIHFNTALDAAEKLYEDNNSLRNRKRLMDISVLVADICMKMEMYPEARIYNMYAAYWESLIYLETGMEEDKEWVIAYCARAMKTLTFAGASCEVRKIFQEFTWTMMIQAEEEKTEEAKGNLASAYFMQSLLSKIEGKEYKKMMKEAHAIWSGLNSDKKKYERLIKTAAGEILDLLERDEIRNQYETMMENMNRWMMERPLSSKSENEENITETEDASDLSRYHGSGILGLDPYYDWDDDFWDEPKEKKKGIVGWLKKLLHI